MQQGPDKFKDLAPRSRTDYQDAFDFLQKYGSSPIKTMTRGKVVKLRDLANNEHHRTFADRV
jgi:hypothetical protein